MEYIVRPRYIAAVQCISWQAQQKIVFRNIGMEMRCLRNNFLTP